jgi:hypothetical protein
MLSRFEKNILEQTLLQTLYKFCECCLSNFRGSEIVASDQQALRERAAEIDIKGCWTGRIEISTSPEFLTDLTSSIFDAETSIITTELLEDSLKELANTLAGNLKTALPEPCRLSLPRMSSSQEDPHNAERATFNYICGSKGIVSIRIYKEQPQKDAAEGGEPPPRTADYPR